MAIHAVAAHLGDAVRLRPGHDVRRLRDHELDGRCERPWQRGQERIPSHHFSIDPTFLVGADLPAGTTVDLWVADAGHLTALEVVSNGVMKLGVEVSNVNDPANVVEAPTS